MKTAVVTGASRGVGRAVAERLAEDGWRILMNCRSRFGQLDEVAERLSLEKGAECIALHCPMGKEVYARYLEMEQDEELILVNNAGVSRIGLLQEMGDDVMEGLVQDNLMGMMRASRDILPYMLRIRRGRILNISSVWGVAGASMETVYSMTKGGVNAFTRALAKELAPSHIPVNALALGAVDTDMNAWLSGADRERLEEEIPYGRMARPSEAAAMACLLLSAPRYLTGQIVCFDGGWI